VTGPRIHAIIDVFPRITRYARERDEGQGMTGITGFATTR
jgi:hypothetical protein